MYIREVLEVYQVPGRKIYVKAIAEECKLIYPQTYQDPAEYGDALVETFISILDLEEYLDCDITEDTIIEDDTMIEYLQEYDFDWRMIEDDYWTDFT